MCQLLCCQHQWSQAPCGVRVACFLQTQSWIYILMNIRKEVAYFFFVLCLFFFFCFRKNSYVEIGNWWVPCDTRESNTTGISSLSLMKSTVDLQEPPAWSLFPFYRRWSWGRKRWIHLPKVTQQVNGSTRNKIPVIQVLVHALWFPHVRKAGLKQWPICQHSEERLIYIINISNVWIHFHCEYSRNNSSTEKVRFIYFFMPALQNWKTNFPLVSLFSKILKCALIFNGTLTCFAESKASALGLRGPWLADTQEFSFYVKMRHFQTFSVLSTSDCNKDLHRRLMGRCYTWSWSVIF